ncbi:MAG: hypothetical protein Q4B73_05530 [Lachnospiraceae bacterium]|nr:hypothetical protein [Lachnospiraceae bacterium]
MMHQELLDKMLDSYVRYYDIKREDVTPPFAAEASFRSHEQQYFLVKSARLSESESREYVFFADTDTLTLSELQRLDETAWQTTMDRVEPHPEHRSTDCTLFVLANQVEAEAASFSKKIKHYRSYHHMFWGWSHYSLVLIEVPTGRIMTNKNGRSLTSLVEKVMHNQ